MATKKKNSSTNLLIQQTVISQINRTNVDIEKWRSAHKAAESVSNPNRTQLYDLNSEIELDTHLSSVVAKRKAAILKKKFVFNREGKPDELINEQIKSPWFISFINDLLDTPFWGGSLFQFKKEGEWIGYDMIPRKHVKFEKGLVVKSQSDTVGVDYKNDLAYKNILEVIYKTMPLGLYLKAAPWVIYKRNGMGDFAQFAEIFGQPMREGIYDGNDDSARQKLVKDLTEAGSSGIFVHPDGTKINIIDTPFKATSTGLFDKIISICNEELSKLILGNTLTTQQGENGARSLGEVNKESEADINVTDEQFVRNVLNYDMVEIFAALGLKTEGGEFEIIEETQDNLSTRVVIDMQLKSGGLPIDDEYFYEKYGIPKPKDYDKMKAAAPIKKLASEPDPEPGKSKTDPPPTNSFGQRRTFLNQLRSFFVAAPHTGHTNSKYCAVCGGEKHYVSHFKNEYSTKVDEALMQAAKAIFLGKVTDIQTSPELALEIGNIWDEAIKENFKAFENLTADDARRIEWMNLQRNGVYTFSTAKSYAEMSEMRNLVFDTSGNKKSEYQYLQDVRERMKVFNENYLKAEYDAVVNGTMQGERWLDITDNAEIAPYLEYVTAGDDRVREAHKTLHGVIEKIDSGFWKQYYPPNGWRCRCTTKQLSEREAKHAGYKEGRTDDNMKLAGKLVPEYWRRNTGEQIILDANQTAYFKFVPGKNDKNQLSAVKHYNMPTAATIAGYSKTPSLKPLSKDEFTAWWRTEAKEGVIELKDYSGLPVRFNKEFSQHMLARPENHFGYANNMVDIAQNPDEVWGNWSKLKNAQKPEYFKVYIKYDKKGPIALFVDADNKPNSLYLVDKKDAWEKLRQGVLLHKK